MNERRSKITFWITVVSFTGSVLFAINIIVFGARSPECKECIKELIYYHHKADSLQHELDNSR